MTSYESRNFSATIFEFVDTIFFKNTLDEALILLGNLEVPEFTPDY